MVVADDLASGENRQIYWAKH